MNFLPGIVILLMAVTFHEFSHGYVAYRFGDDTPRLQGRLTLNPFAHLDFVGSLVVPFILFILGAPIFGWAKPVQFNPLNFKRSMTMRNGIALVGLAGPAANVALAILFALVYRVITLTVDPGANSVALGICNYVVFLNLFLAVFNMIPFPPLDGSRVILPFLPRQVDDFFTKIERSPYFIFILIFALNFLHIFYYMSLFVGFLTVMLTGAH